MQDRMSHAPKIGDLIRATRGDHVTLGRVTHELLGASIVEMRWGILRHVCHDCVTIEILAPTVDATTA